ncbi:hypothetical protein NSR52_004530 [Salmonella enterica]|nr:hypothetical protein [Salmonella enterica subsp. enterica]EJW2021848.1 hypothetical protein [Salmonella enterica]EJW2026347.1 hypothetical protein [Salmonella enterica]EJW2102416.1 hypothetical protein [Salmonella enterica]
MPYLNNQLLELEDPTRPLERKDKRNAFKEQVEKAAKIPGIVSSNEVERNRIFLKLQDMVSTTLKISQDDITWNNALLRFKAVAEEIHEDID